MIKGGPTISSNGLVLYLDAGNSDSYTSGSTTWFDLSGYDNRLNLTNGPTFSTASNGSILLDGTNDYLITNANSTPNLDITSQLTLDAWIRSTALANSNHGDGIFSKGLSSDGNTGVYEFLLTQVSSSNYPYFRLRLGSTTYFHNPTGSVINLNSIYNIVGTFNGTVMRVYVNGVESGTSYSASGTIAANTEQLTIGVRYRIRASGTDDSFFSGNIYSTKIYNRALTSSEILNNYNMMKGRFGLT